MLKIKTWERKRRRDIKRQKIAILGVRHRRYWSMMRIYACSYRKIAFLENALKSLAEKADSVDKHTIMMAISNRKSGDSDAVTQCNVALGLMRGSCEDLSNKG